MQQRGVDSRLDACFNIHSILQLEAIWSDHVTHEVLLLETKTIPSSVAAPVRTKTLCVIIPGVMILPRVLYDRRGCYKIAAGAIRSPRVLYTAGPVVHPSLFRPRMDLIT